MKTTKLLRKAKFKKSWQIVENRGKSWKIMEKNSTSRMKGCDVVGGGSFLSPHQQERVG